MERRRAMAASMGGTADYLIENKHERRKRETARDEAVSAEQRLARKARRRSMLTFEPSKGAGRNRTPGPLFDEGKELTIRDEQFEEHSSDAVPGCPT